MTKQELIAQIRKKGSFLCVGLDTDIEKIPEFLLDREDPVFEFNKMIIDATKEFCVAYKPNIAFYESMGVSGWESLEKTLAYIPSDIFTISDAKRGDIGNTSKMYAKAFFENMSFDSVTVAPYMGEDSVRPFTDFKNKWVILLGLTSNAGSQDFQKEKLEEEGQYLYEKVLTKSQEWGTTENMMYVIGATHGKTFASIRKIIPNHFLLVPGVGAQGGSLADVAQYGLNKDCGLLVNSSRGIIYADKTEQFAKVAGEKAQEMQQEMQQILKNAAII